MVDLDSMIGAHEALDRLNGSVGMFDRLSLGGHADQTCAIFDKADYRRRGSQPFRVGNNDRFAALDCRHA